MKAAAALVAEDLLTSFYHGNEPGQTPGIFDDTDYYWWSGSALWATLLDFRARTGNTSYDDIILQGLQWQVGQGYDYLPANWSASEGNDDQSLWAQAALTAAQTNFTEPADAETQWLGLAQNVFDEQTGDARRVDDGDSACNGALRWQIFTFNNGYNYVNSELNLAKTFPVKSDVRLKIVPQPSPMRYTSATEHSLLGSTITRPQATRPSRPTIPLRA